MLLLSPMGMLNGGLNQLYVDGSHFVLDESKSDKILSAMEFLMNGTWIGVSFKNAKVTAPGQITFRSQGWNQHRMFPTEIRYAWDGSCCPGISNAYIPCPTKNCPIMQQFNVSASLQEGKEAGLPANPFWTKVITETKGQSAKCECFKPQVC